jgi:uncharacterized protein
VAIRWIRAFAAALLLAVAWLAQAQSAPGLRPIPPLTGPVMDATGTLSSQDQATLGAKLAALERDKGAQVVLLMVPTTAPEDIAAYANRVGNAWKIGRKDVGDGLLLLVAKNDRRVRIEVAKTLEGAVPDLAANQIIENAITPAFRRGDFAGGLNAAVDQIGALIRGEPLPPVATRPAGARYALPLLIFGLILAGARGVTGRLLGRGLGSVVSVAAVGTLSWLTTHNLSAAVIFGMFALAFAYLGTNRRSGEWVGPVFLPASGGFGGGSGGGFGGGFSSGDRKSVV